MTLEFLEFFSATVANLQAKVEQLTTTNALMKEDLAIARNGLLTLQAENAALRNAQHAHAPHIVDTTNVLDRIDPEMAETLAEERKKRQEMEKELELQVFDPEFSGFPGFPDDFIFIFRSA